MALVTLDLKDFEELCRICTNKTNLLLAMHIFEGVGYEKDLLNKIQDCLPIKVELNDELPKVICTDCIYKLDLLYDFRKLSRNSESVLSSLINKLLVEKDRCNTLQRTLVSHFTTNVSLDQLNLNKVLESENNYNSQDGTLAVTSNEQKNLLVVEEENIQSINIDGTEYLIATEAGDYSTFFFCTQCNKTFPTQHLFDEHCVVFHWDSCEPCSAVFSSQESYIIHRSEFHPKVISEEAQELLLHNIESFQNLPQQISNEDEQRPLISQSSETVSPKTLVPVDNVITDEKVVENPQKNEPNLQKEIHVLQKNKSISQKEVYNPRKEVHIPHKVKQTPQRVEPNSSEEDEDDPVDGKYIFQCQKCDREFRTIAKYNKHAEHHKKTPPLKCSECGKAFRSKIGLLQHEAKHTGKFDFQCNTCGKGFQVKSYLISHQKIHSDKKAFKCSLCSQAFKSKSALQKHHHKHFGVKPFKCEKCDRGFMTKALLQNHEKVIHQGVDARKFPCPVCNKLFVSKAYLKVHQNIHADDRPFKCDFCAKGFLTIIDLNIHRTKHTGVKAFTCNVCNKSFARQYALRCHQRKHTGERPYKCNICGQTFTQFTPLTIHKRLHTGERPYSCKRCDKTFISSNTLLSHQKTHDS